MADNDSTHCTLETRNARQRGWLSLDQAERSLAVLHRWKLSYSSLMIMFLSLRFFVQRCFFPRFGNRPRITWNGLSDRTVFAMRLIAGIWRGYQNNTQVWVPGQLSQATASAYYRTIKYYSLSEKRTQIIRLIRQVHFHDIMKGQASNRSE